MMERSRREKDPKKKGSRNSKESRKRPRRMINNVRVSFVTLLHRKNKSHTFILFQAVEEKEEHGIFGIFGQD